MLVERELGVKGPVTWVEGKRFIHLMMVVVVVMVGIRKMVAIIILTLLTP